MKQTGNRIEQEMENWLAKEQRFGRLFSPAILGTPEFQKEKLAYLEAVRRKYKKQLSPDERLTMRVLGRERRRLEKQLYPNLLVRLARRGILSAARSIRNLVEDRKISGNHQMLQEQIAAIGFGRVDGGLREQMREGKERFSVPVSWYHSEKDRLNFEMQFSKSKDGNYRLDGYAASMRNETDGSLRAHDFRMKGNEVTAAQAAHLLSGRAIEKDGKWLQLDLNDKDGQGQYKTKQFHPGYGYDLLKAVQQLPLKELKDETSQQALLAALRNGERPEVTARVKGKDQALSIEANPQFKSVNVYDDKGKKLSLPAALGKEQKPELKIVHKQAVQKRNGMSIGNQ